MDEKKIVRIYSENTKPGPTDELKVVVGDEVIPYVQKVELGENGELVHGDFIMARITVAVKLGK
ncbi:TPA: hypothetical protein UMV35_000886 [Stenotrophomonas maltophilia]|uniref:hypothetical protein n=1 Tax=Stenotrophomonas sp. GD03680 TaxID=2975365 RepID=UPI0018D27502|nr:hypothetical protein [Stenotrophomonas sp. GD03680]MBH1593599.1 hypothetical protein [Stenotrophomonas maltophilia]MDH2022503.1 hypothetical protein [Stenotrophomonas sp. GD03680]HEL3748627.1 hypothetical protein [Stenotrophomonas maltophilia]HEL7729623.1 hypothetical protein [Stenotrophomonas maltophilia]